MLHRLKARPSSSSLSEAHLPLKRTVKSLTSTGTLNVNGEDPAMKIGYRCHHRIGGSPW